MGIRRHLIGNLLLAAIGAIVWSCTELGEDTGPHPEDWEDIHQAKLQASYYDLTSCRSCHGEDLQGTDVALGCQTSDCHPAPGGAAACDNCHGYLDSDPFVDVKGRTSSDLVTVGMHTSHYQHLHELADTANVNCGSCHVVPDPVWAAGHIDDTPYAEVTFDSLATAGGTLSPVWDRSAGTCSDVYCHGAFDFNDVTGNDSTWTWTTAIDTDLCGTCHGLPPVGHIASGDACGQCHSGVVSSQDHRTIIDTQKHINGVKNVFGN